MSGPGLQRRFSGLITYLFGLPPGAAIVVILVVGLFFGVASVVADVGHVSDPKFNDREVGYWFAPNWAFSHIFVIPMMIFFILTANLASREAFTLMARLKMLLDKNSCRHQRGDLIAIFNGLERGPHCNLGLAKSNVAAQQAIHGNITGAGSAEVTIEGVASLGGANHPVMPDRIETGSYAIAALITGGTLTLEGARADLLGDVLPAFQKTGGTIEETDDGLLVHNGQGRPKPLTITTQPFPGFATDMQAQFMALLALGRGTSEITETIFENRYMHVPELRRMGADIEVGGSKATIRGVDHLIGAPVMATDLRASMCLVLAALAAEGETTLSRVYHLDRGYEHLETKLGQVGAVIERVVAKG